LALFFTLTLGYFIFYPNEYKYITTEDPWNKAEYIKTIVLFIAGSLASIGALYIGYKKIKTKKPVYSYMFYIILVLVLFFLIRGIYKWYLIGFDHF
jgi:cell division protein FtsW (lipid II flippase)